MYTKIEIKQEDSLSAPQNEREFSNGNVTMKTENNIVLLDNDCDMAMKLEIKSESSAPELCFQKDRGFPTKHHIKHIKAETVTNCEMNKETDFGSQSKREFLQVTNIEKYNTNHEIDPKIEIKEEYGWLETGISSVYNEIKDEEFPPLISPRSCIEEVCFDSSGKSPLPSNEDLRKNVSLCLGKDSPADGDSRGSEAQVSHVTEKDSVEKRIYSEQCSEYNDDGKNYSKASYLKQKNEVKRYKCSVCEKVFQRLSALKRHNLIHEGKKQHKCIICEKRFSELSHLKRHHLIHEGKKPHKCEICEKRFTELSHLKRHKLIHEGKKPYKCDICKKKFTQWSTLKRHNLIHEGKQPHQCDICEKRLSGLSSLKMHYLTHEEQKLYKCETCERRFTLLPHLKRHNLIHEGKKPYKCQICEKMFTELYYLKRHNLIHEDKKAHKCEICEKRFTQLSTLKTHSLIHEGKKAHKCDICEKRFTRLSHLKRHVLAHEGKKPYICTICEKGFTQLCSLKRHNLIHEHKC